jgi:hypothetical protein
MHFKQQIDRNVTKQSFNAGFDECLKQVQHFMKCLPFSDKLNHNANNGADTADRNQISQKLLTHLDFCRLELTHNDVVADDADAQRPDASVDNHNMHNIDIDRYYDQNILNQNTFSVIQHTRNYSSSISSTSSNSSTHTVSPPTTPEPRHRPMDSTSTSTSQLPPDFIPEFRGLRANSVGRYETDRNGQRYELGADGVWRPW